MAEVTKALIYGSISTGVVSLLSLGGAFIVPLLRGPSKHRWMSFFISMAVATLSSDSLMHILPQILGLHNHSAGEHDHAVGEKHEHEHEHHDHDHEHGHSHEHHSHENANEHLQPAAHTHAHDHNIGLFDITPERSIMLHMTLVILAVYLLYIIEFCVYNRKKSQNCRAAGGQSISGRVILEDTESSGSDSRKSTCQTNGIVEVSAEDDDAVFCCGLKSRAVVILVGDGFHNLVDGVAIGASFLASTRLGIVTTLAVICHELPHELGDLAVLLDSGLSMAKALILNLLSALTAFVGLYLSIIIGYNAEAERMLLAITAGMFLYVAWIDMLAHLKHAGSHSDHWLIVCFLQTFGFFIGFAMVFSLGWFEHDLFH